MSDAVETQKWAPRGPQTPTDLDGMKLLRWVTLWIAFYLERGFNPTLLYDMQRRIQFDMKHQDTRKVNEVKFVTAGDLEKTLKVDSEEEDGNAAKKPRTE